MADVLPKEHEELIAGLLAGKLGAPVDSTGFEACRLGGLTNFNYLVKAGDFQAVFRIPGEGTESIVDRAVERNITRAASEIGVDSELLCFDADSGVKVMAFIPNPETMHSDTIGKPENIRLVAGVLRKLHDEGAPVDFRFDVFEMIPQYEEAIRKNEEIGWEGYDELREKLYGFRDRMSSSGVALCHCDPLCENFVKDAESGRMYLIDWEYGGMNDPLWDIADVIIESGYDRAQRDLFQESYFGRPATADEDERITINIVLIDFLWALWGKQRSYYDHSLDDYGPERFARAKRNFETLQEKAAS